MSLASVWKFGVLGLAIAMGSLSIFLTILGVNSKKLSWSFNNMVPFHLIVFIIVLILGVGSLVSERVSHKFLVTIFLVSTGVHVGLLYLTVNPLWYLFYLTWSDLVNYFYKSKKDVKLRSRSEETRVFILWQRWPCLRAFVPDLHRCKVR